MLADFIKQCCEPSELSYRGQRSFKALKHALKLILNSS